MDDPDADINTYCSILKAIYLFLDNNNLPKTAEAFMQEIVAHNEKLKDVNFNDIPTRTVILRPQDTDAQNCKDCIICISNTPEENIVVEELCTCIDKEDTAQKPNEETPLDQFLNGGERPNSCDSSRKSTKEDDKKPSVERQSETPKHIRISNVDAEPTEASPKSTSKSSMETQTKKPIETPRTSNKISKVGSEVSNRPEAQEVISEEAKNPKTPSHSSAENDQQLSTIPKQSSASASADNLDSNDISESDLDFDTIEEHLMGDDDLIKIKLLQALRWRLTKTNGEERDFNMNSFINHDILFMKSGSFRMFESFLCPGKSPNALQEAFARFIDTIASMSAGRDYLELDYHPYQIVVLPVLMNRIRNITINTLTKEFLLATVQKLSLSKSMRDIIIDCGGVEWLINNMQHYHSTVSSYEAEYSVALLMNLCLNKETGERCESLVDSVAELLMELLMTPHECCLYYLPGIFFALFMHSPIYKATMALGALPKLKDLCKTSPNSYVYKQLETIFLMNLWENPEKMCMCDVTMSPDCYGDYLEVELDMNDFTFDNELVGEDFLALYKNPNYNPSQAIQPVGRKSCICKQTNICGVDKNLYSDPKPTIPLHLIQRREDNAKQHCLPPEIDSDASEMTFNQLKITDYSSPESQIYSNLGTQTGEPRRSDEKLKGQASTSTTQLGSGKDTPANMSLSEEPSSFEKVPEKPKPSLGKKMGSFQKDEVTSRCSEKCKKGPVSITAAISSIEKQLILPQNEVVNMRAEISTLEKRPSPAQKESPLPEPPAQKKSSLIKARRSTQEKVTPKCAKCKKKKLKSIEVVLKDSTITGVNANSEPLHPSLVSIEKGVQTEVGETESAQLQDKYEKKVERKSELIKEVPQASYPPILVPCRLSYYYYNKEVTPTETMVCKLMPEDNKYSCRCFNVDASSKDEMPMKKPQTSIVGGRRASNIVYGPVHR